MTTTENAETPRRRRPRVAAAAARAAIEMREHDGREIPDWLRAAAADTPAVPSEG